MAREDPLVGVYRDRERRRLTEERERVDLPVVRRPGQQTFCEVLLRPATLDEMCASARSAFLLAQAAGWTVQATFCRGWQPRATSAGKAHTVASVALRCEWLAWDPESQPHIVTAFAIYLDGKWDCGRLGGPYLAYGAVEWRAAIKCGAWRQCYETRGWRT